MMSIDLKRACRKFAAIIVACGALVAAPISAQQIETVDPDLVIDADLDGGADAATTSDGTWIAPASQAPAAPNMQVEPSIADVGLEDAPSDRYANAASDTALPADGTPAAPTGTYAEDDLIGAAEGVFGRGAEGLARLIENILDEQGEPNGYIVGREGGGAFILGVRYGSGTLHHKIEGNMPVYWTGPSIGIDAGANAGNTFVLVYNLHDSDELYERYPAAEGQAYFVGGFNASYLRKGNVVLIPIRVGAGLRLGVNAGYMRFSRKQRWLPF